MPESSVLPVLGLPVRFTADAPALLDAVEERFGAWRALPAAAVGGAPVATFQGPGDAGSGPPRLPLRVELTLRDGLETDGPVAVRHDLLSGRRVRFSTEGSSALADPLRGEARASVTPGLLGRGALFGRSFLEAMTLALVTAYDRTPLHAAGVVRGGSAFLLAGPSGAGKSSLVLAAALAGDRLLAEDTVFLQSRPTLRVWGLPGPLRLPPGAARHFPELWEAAAAAPGDESKRLLEPPALPEDAWASPPLSDRAILCILGGGEGGPAAEPIEPGTAVDALTRRLDPGFDRFGGVLPGLLRELAGRGSWRLRRGPHPRDLLPCLETILERTSP